MGDWKGDPPVRVRNSIAIFAPDAEAHLIEDILRNAGCECLTPSVDSLIEAIGSGFVGTAIVAEEMLPTMDRPELRRAIEEQPTWSDFPFIVIVRRESLADIYGKVRALDHVAIVERPLHPAILLNEVQAALRNRIRQRESEAYLLQREIAEEHLRQLTATLEARVAERTRDLEEANAQLTREVEERRVAEERLRESEEMYRYTVELSQQIAWTADAEGDLISVTPRFAAITGVEMTGKLFDRWLSVVHPDDLSILGRWGESLRTHEPYSANYRIRVADGSYRLFNSTAMPRLADDGSVIRWYGFTRDIEEQRQAEERLRESEELYRYTVELSQQIVWTSDGDGDFQTISPRFYTITGLPEGSFPLDAIHPEDLGRVVENRTVAFATGKSLVNEFRLRMADGSYRQYRARAAPRRDDSGRIIRWYGTIEDVHEQKQADLARLEAEERYRLAARATDDAIWDLDIVKNEIRWSDSASIFFGYPGGEGFTSAGWWVDRLHPEDRDRVVNSLQEAKEGTATRWTAEYRFLSADGSFADVHDRGFIIRDQTGRAIRAVGAMADVSDRRRAEAELRKMQGELIHVSRLSAMGAMASTLAHEINQPLTAVTSYLRGSRRLLCEESDPPIDQIREAIEAAEAGALRAGQIVRRLRELVARGNVSVLTEDLPKLIEDACVLGLVDAHLLGVSHRIEIDPEARWVEADRIQIEQVLINLIRNSVQAMKDRPVREVTIRTRAFPPGFAEVSVEDTGIGLSQDVLKALFSPFRSTKVEGMGIGLSICRTIVEAHRGKIWAENREGGGAIFRFTLPLSEGAAMKSFEEGTSAETPL